MVLATACVPGSAESETSYGLTGGWSRTTWSGDARYSTFETKNGFAAGLYAEQSIRSRWGFRAEILYHRKGTKDSVLNVDEQVGIPHAYKLYFDMDYLQAPCLLRFYFDSKQDRGFFVSAGLAPARELGAQINQDPVTEVFDLSSDLESTADWDLGGVMGLGLRMRGSGREASVEIRYERGTREVLHELVSASMSLGTYPVRNSSISILGAVGF